MDSIKGIVTGTIITLIIGGTAYNISQEDVIQNFADDTGMTQKQAELYINEIPEEEFDTFSVIGSDFINEGQEFLTMANDINCVNYEYDWESTTLSCLEGKSQLNKLARNSSLLGYAFKKLDSDSASEEDIAEAIRLIDQLNANYELEISYILWDQSTISEAKKTNSYNRSILKAALESD